MPYDQFGRQVRSMSRVVVGTPPTSPRSEATSGGGDSAFAQPMELFVTQTKMPAKYTMANEEENLVVRHMPSQRMGGSQRGSTRSLSPKKGRAPGVFTLRDEDLDDLTPDDDFDLASEELSVPMSPMARQASEEYGLNLAAVRPTDPKAQRRPSQALSASLVPQQKRFSLPAMFVDAHISIQWALGLIILVLVISAVGTNWAISQENYDRSVNDLSRTSIESFELLQDSSRASIDLLEQTSLEALSLLQETSEKSIDRVIGQLEIELLQRITSVVGSFMESATLSCEISAKDIELTKLSLSLDPAPVHVLESHYLYHIVRFNQVVLVYLGRDDGKFFGARRSSPDDDADFQLYEHSLKPGNFTRVQYVIDPFTGERSGVVQARQYDATQRPWYIETLAARRPIWSSVYLFASFFALGITSTFPVFDPVSGNITAVAAVDLTLQEISNFLQRQSYGTSGVGYMVERTGANEGFLVGVSRGPVTVVEGDALLRIAAVDHPDSLVRDTASGLVESLGSWSAIEDDLAFFNGTSDGEVIIVGIARLQDELGLEWVLVSAIPESDFLGQVRNTTEQVNADIEASLADTSVDIDDTLDVTLETIQRSLDRTNNQIQSNDDVFLVISIVSVLATIVLVYVGTLAVAKPLKLLSYRMDALARLEFTDVDRDATPGEAGSTASTEFSEESIEMAPGSRWLSELREIEDQFSNLQRALAVFAKYVPKAVVRRVVAGDETATSLYVAKRKVTVMFSDVANFTTMTELIPAKDLMPILFEYLTQMSRLVERYQGTVGDFMGDGMISWWNSPTDVQHHASKACYSLLFQSKVLRTLNQRWRRRLNQHYRPVRARFGINTGWVLAGNIGSPERFKYDIIGDTVNVAARLEGVCKLYGVDNLVAEETFKQVQHEFLFRPVDLIAVKGRSQPTMVYEMLNTHKDATEEQRFIALLATRAVNMYLSRSFDFCQAALSELLERIPDDQPSKVLLARVEEYQQNPPPSQWTGVHVLSTK